jgi:hypothetical protein
MSNQDNKQNPNGRFGNMAGRRNMLNFGTYSASVPAGE